MFPAEWSGESAVENQQDVELSLEVRQGYTLTFKIH
jgi:hypothetical protein